MAGRSEKPWLWIVGGPNGAGKTTLAGYMFAADQIVNPDVIAQRMAPAHPEKVGARAGREALLEARRRLDAGKTFAVETTLSGKSHERLIAEAKARGFRVGLFYICLSHKERLMARIKQRKQRGGHTVPAEDIRRRYDRSLKNVSKVFQQADFAQFYDNSRPNMRTVVMGGRGKIDSADKNLPKWVRGSLKKELERFRDRGR